MSPSDLIAFLRDYNRWRQGEVLDQPSPQAITEALDTACAALDQLERWRELAAFLAACLRDCGTIDSHAWHSRGTALESYERLKTNGTEPH
jgi:hypothetical protein